MKRQILYGQGIQGIHLTLNVCDMFEANMVSDELLFVIQNHKDCEEYAKCPFDRRKELYPDGQPKRFELSEKTLTNLHKLMCKLAYSSKSTLFEEDDDVDDDE